MCDIYKFVLLCADDPTPLTHELMQKLLCFSCGRHEVDNRVYEQAYMTTLLDDMTTLLDDIPVTVVDLDEHYPGTGAFYVSTDKSLRNFDESVRTVAELCAKLKEIMLAYSKNRQGIL